MFVVVTVRDNTCVNIWVYGEDWMPKVYDILWSLIVLLAVVLMAGLYSRVVYTLDLWFKRDVHDNQLAFQQRVSVSVESLHSKESRNIAMFVVI